MPNAIIIGSDCWSERCQRRLDAAGWTTDTLVGAAADVERLTPADVIVLALEPARRDPWLKALFRMRRTAFLLRELPGQGPGDATALARAARKRRTRVGILGGWRFAPLIARTREWTEGGILGTARSLDMTLELASYPSTAIWFAALDVALLLSAVEVGTRPLDLQTRQGSATFTYEACAVRVVLTSASAAAGQAVTFRLEADNGTVDGSMPLPAAGMGAVLASQVMHTSVDGRARSLKLPATTPADNELLVACTQLARGEQPVSLCDAARGSWVLGMVHDIMQALDG